LPVSNPPASGKIRIHAHAVFDAERLHRFFDVAKHQAVMILRRNSADLPFEEIGGAETANLAGADQIRPAPTASPGSAFRRSGRCT
jgi:hypothetical protein